MEDSGLSLCKTQLNNNSTPSGQALAASMHAHTLHALFIALLRNYQCCIHGNNQTP